MDTKKLRQKILDLAIHGKLVPQDPNDEPASVLLERVRAEKEQLIKEGKIKAPKKSKSAGDTSHYGKEGPWELPEGWEWTTIGSISHDLQYGTSEKSSCKGPVPVLRMGNITRLGTIDYSDLVYSSDEEDIKKFSLNYDDLLFNRTNSSEWVGKTAIFKSKIQAIYAGYLIRIRTIGIAPDYLNIVMNSAYHRNWCNQVKTDAVNQSNINAQKLAQYLVPIPPIEEQFRIILEAERYLKIIEQIRDLNVALSEYLTQAKTRILELAIHGKLVPQDPTDEPAIELLKRINPDFVPSHNLHYEGEQPNGWCIITFGEVAEYINGRAFKPEEWEKEGLPIIRIQNLNDTSAQYNRTSGSYEERYLIHYGDILFAWAASLNAYIWDGNDAWLNQHIFKVIPKECVLPKYLYYTLKAKIHDFYQRSHGSGMVHITRNTFLKEEFLLPPLKEQERIIVAIEKVYSAMDLLTSHLTT